MERLLTTKPRYLFIFEVDDATSAELGPVRVNIPNAVVQKIREHVDSLAPGEDPDVSLFNMPEGVVLKWEKLTPDKPRLMLAVNGEEVRRYSEDITRDYVPEALRLPAPWTIEVGRGDHRRLVQASWADDPRGREWVDVSPDQDGSHWSEFRGLREQVDINLSTHNFRESNDWKGRDEIRGTAYWTVAIDRIQVGDGSARDPFTAMDDARDYARKALRFGSGGENGPMIQSWRDADKMLGQGVWYHQQEAVVTRLVLDQGCVIIEPAMADEFEPDRRFGREGMSDDKYERQNYKVEMFSPHLYWHRDTKNDLRQFVPVGEHA